MAHNDKDQMPAVGNLSPGQLQSHLKMEPKTLGVSKRITFYETNHILFLLSDGNLGSDFFMTFRLVAVKHS